MKKTFALVALGTATIVTIGALPASAERPGNVPVEEAIPILASEQAAADQPPAQLKLEDLGGVQPETVRYLGEHENFKYWVGRTEADQVCLIALAPSESYSAGAACAAVPDFYGHGISLKTGSAPDTDPVAYLLPADVSAGSVVPTNALSRARSEEGGNLLVVSPAVNADLKPAKVSRSNGISYNFAPLPENR